MTFYIIPNEIYHATNWQASNCCNVGPVAVYSGPYAGSYAVNANIFDSDNAFESFRELLESYPIAHLTPDELAAPHPQQES